MTVNKISDSLSMLIQSSLVDIGKPGIVLVGAASRGDIRLFELKNRRGDAAPTLAQSKKAVPESKRISM